MNDDETILIVCNIYCSVLFSIGVYFYFVNFDSGVPNI